MMRHTNHSPYGITSLTLSLRAFLLLCCLWLGYLGTLEAQPRVVHMGDSHIRYGYSTLPIKEELQGYEVVHTGINGATFATYLQEETYRKLLGLQPDILVISLGTNDSYSSKFNAEEIRANMEQLLDRLTSDLPNLRILMTSPPPNYLRHSHRVRIGKRRRKRSRISTTYSFNTNTAKMGKLIAEVARGRGFGFFDLYDAIGGESGAKTWLEQGWMHTDHVHYSQQGYYKQGKLIAPVLIQYLNSSTSPRKTQ